MTRAGSLSVKEAGARGGASTSERKARASRENAKKARAALETKRRRKGER
mgnify:CR=1 FL=1